MWLKRALKDFSKHDLSGLVIDLRGNTGGSMRQACLTVDAFMEKGLTLRTVGRDDKPVSGLMKQYYNRAKKTQRASSGGAGEWSLGFSPRDCSRCL